MTDCSMIYFTGLRFYKIAYLVYFTLDKRKIIVLDKRQCIILFVMSFVFCFLIHIALLCQHS